MKYRRACAQKFALYLQKNSHLSRDSTISKSEAGRHYVDFKNLFGVGFGFGNLLINSRNFMRFIPGGLLQYKRQQLAKMSAEEAQIDAVLSSKRSTDDSRNDSAVEVSGQMPECKLCGLTFEDKEGFERHSGEGGHRFLRDLKKAWKTLPELRFTINESPVLQDLIVRKDVPTDFQIKVENVSKGFVTIPSIQTDTTITEVSVNLQTPCKIRAKDSIVWKLTVHCQKNGALSFPLLIFVERRSRTQKYVVELVFHTHEESFDDLHPVAPYQRAAHNLPDDYVVVNRTPPRAEKENPALLPLEQYRIPNDLFAILNANFRPSGELSKKQAALLDHLKSLANKDDKLKSLTVFHNYTELLTFMLHAEEHEMLKEVKRYDREQAFKGKSGGLLELEVPGLAEGRPSILPNDIVHVRDGTTGRTYDGVVCRLNESSVLLRFHNSFVRRSYVEGKQYHISFTVNRFALRVQHQAVGFVKSDHIEQVYFPRVPEVPPEDLNVDDMVWFNEDIANNPEQRLAVRAILRKSAVPAPYLIFGPPGTGKTMTVVECVKQIYKRTNDRVLICAPSNSAGNEICKRLIDYIPKDGLFRYVARSFSEHMPRELLAYSNCHSKSFYHPDMKQLAGYRVIITTLISAGKLVNLRCPKDHFSYVFIDEAGQATETETLMPISGLLSNRESTGCVSGQIVLAGDPRQLGPVVLSAVAKQYGYGTSTLERLIDTCDLYAKNSHNEYNSYAMTKLLQNYRSHSAIIDVPNRLFYDGELRVAGNETINTAVGWSGLPNETFPLVFHNVIGVDQRESTSPSFFNIQEIQVVADYLDRLIGTTMKGVRIDESHIMIISPYKKQVEKIRQYCAKKKYRDLLIGSVEQIQGQERLIVIVSAVRSQPKMLEFDEKYHLGFLKNPKRFNVAITRAKALLIVVGNSRLLQYDKYWKCLVEYCRNNGAIVGDKEDLEGDEEETLSDAQNMSLLDETEEGPSFSGEVQ